MLLEGVIHSLTRQVLNNDLPVAPIFLQGKFSYHIFRHFENCTTATSPCALLIL